MILIIRFIYRITAKNTLLNLLKKKFSTLYISYNEYFLIKKDTIYIFSFNLVIYPAFKISSNLQFIPLDKIIFLLIFGTIIFKRLVK